MWSEKQLSVRLLFYNQNNGLPKPAQLRNVRQLQLCWVLQSIPRCPHKISEETKALLLSILHSYNCSRLLLENRYVRSQGQTVNAEKYVIQHSSKLKSKKNSPKTAEWARKKYFQFMCAGDQQKFNENLQQSTHLPPRERTEIVCILFHLQEDWRT